MKLVINVPDYVKEQADDGKGEELGIPLWLAYEIANGTPLPKGHGRLIDAGALPLNAIDDANHGSNYIKIAPTIIEADKKYEDEVITRGKCMICGKELTEGLFFCKECGDKANSRK